MSKPSLLFINRVYPPAEGATGQLLAELAPELVRRGFAVTVLTSRPTPETPQTRVERGVRIECVGGLPFTRASHWRRALSYLSLYPALLWRARQLPRHDIVVTLTDPPLQLLLGPVLRWLKGSQVVHWAQDVYPELAEELGVLSRGSLLARALRRASTWALRQSQAVIAVGDCMKKRLVDRGVPAQAIAVVPNWGQAAPAPSEKCLEFRRRHQLDQKFVVMYSGNLGLAHPFEAILDAAERMRISAPEVAFVFVGSGPRLPWVQKQVQQRHLDNVRFLPFQERQELPASLGAADIHLASMRHELCGLVVPSKVYGVLAAGRPCVFLGPEESEAAQVIMRNSAGSVLAKATGARLAACLTQWARNPGRLSEAREHATQLAGRLNCVSAADGFAEIFELVHPSVAVCSPADAIPQAA